MTYRKPPDHYKPLPKGVRCRCMKMWSCGDGTFMCCGAGEDRENENKRLVFDLNTDGGLHPQPDPQPELCAVAASAVEDTVPNSVFAADELREVIETCVALKKMSVDVRGVLIALATAKAAGFEVEVLTSKKV